MGVGRGPTPTPMVPRFVKKWPKMAKIGPKTAKNRPKSKPNLGAMGVVPSPLPPGVQKKRNPGHFLQGKNRNWATILGGSSPPPYPMGSKIGLLYPPCPPPQGVCKTCKTWSRRRRKIFLNFFSPKAKKLHFLDRKWTERTDFIYKTPKNPAV